MEGITERHFKGIEFVLGRISHNESGYDAIPKQMAAAYGSGNADNIPLDPQLAELVRLLCSIRDVCAYCTILHTREARALGVPDAKINILRGWRESLMFTDAESAALNYAEVVSDQKAEEMQAAHEWASKHFSRHQIEVLLMVVINMNMWTRLFLGQGKQPKLVGEE